MRHSLFSRVLCALFLGFLGISAQAQVRISSLPAAATLTGSEMIPMVQSGADVIATPAALLTYIRGQLSGWPTISGTPTAGDCAKWISAGVLGDAGGACGAGSGATTTPGGSTGQLEYNNAGAFGGFTLGGDCTLTVPNIVCTKSNGVSFAPSAFTNTMDASNITSGTLATSLLAPGAAASNLGFAPPSVTGSPVAGTLAAFAGASSIEPGNLSGDCATSNTLAVICTMTNGVAFGPYATATSITSVNGWAFNAATVSLTGTTGQTYTLPPLGGTLAALNQAQTWTGNQTFPDGIITSNLSINSAASITFAGAGWIRNITPGPCVVAGVTTCTVTKANGTALAVYTLTAGTPTGSTVTLSMTAASDGYACSGDDITSTLRLQETTDSTTAPVLTAYSMAGVVTTFGAGDRLKITCWQY
jgi:hypothetical protein